QRMGALRGYLGSGGMTLISRASVLPLVQYSGQGCSACQSWVTVRGPDLSCTLTTGFFSSPLLKSSATRPLVSSAVAGWTCCSTSEAKLTSPGSLACAGPPLAS